MNVNAEVSFSVMFYFYFLTIPQHRRGSQPLIDHYRKFSTGSLTFFSSPLNFHDCNAHAVIRCILIELLAYTVTLNESSCILITGENVLLQQNRSQHTLVPAQVE